MKTLLLCLLAASASACLAQQPVYEKIPGYLTPYGKSDARALRPGAKIYIEPMNGFESSLTAAFTRRHVPVVVVDKEKADYIISGGDKSDAAFGANTNFVRPPADTGASVTIKKATNGSLVYACAVDTLAAGRSSQKAAEACAKHLRHYMED